MTLGLMVYHAAIFLTDIVVNGCAAYRAAHGPKRPEFRLRLPEHLKAEIEKIAKFNNRSINAEIVARLASSIERDVASLEERVDQLDEKLDQLSKALEDLANRFDKFQYEANPARFERN